MAKDKWEHEECGFSNPEDEMLFAVHKGGVADGKIIAFCALQGDAEMVCDALNQFDPMGEVAEWEMY